PCARPYRDPRRGRPRLDPRAMVRDGQRRTGQEPQDGHLRHLRGQAAQGRRPLAVQRAADSQRVPARARKRAGESDPLDGRAGRGRAMIDFAGRTAFVTGGANGVGIGIVRNLLEAGAKVAIADIRQDAIDRALASLDNRAVMGVRLDVMSRTGFEEAADKVEAEFGPVSLLFNNAGINLFQTIEDSSYDDWDWVLGVNLGGVINGVMTFAPRMKARAQSGEVVGGHIVNTASMASFIASGDRKSVV